MPIECDHNWMAIICGNLKMISVVLALQAVHTKHLCFCVCGTQGLMIALTHKLAGCLEQVLHRSRKCQICLFDPQNILLPSLLIKLGLMKSYINALDKDGSTCTFLRMKFPRTFEAKLLVGVFDLPQIRELTKDEDSTASLSAAGKIAWIAFRVVISNFLGKHRSPDYEEQIKKLLESF